MSSVRAGMCREPGPYDAHCTEDLNHKWSCYDAGEDTSWNDRSPEGWQTETPHQCDDKSCPLALALAYRDEMSAKRQLTEHDQTMIHNLLHGTGEQS